MGVFDSRHSGDCSAIFIDPQLKLVMVQTAANATAKAGLTTLGKDADAFWCGVVRHYGSW